MDIAIILFNGVRNLENKSWKTLASTIVRERKRNKKWWSGGELARGRAYGITQVGRKMGIEGEEVRLIRSDMRGME